MTLYTYAGYPQVLTYNQISIWRVISQTMTEQTHPQLVSATSNSNDVTQLGDTVLTKERE